MQGCDSQREGKERKRSSSALHVPGTRQEGRGRGAVVGAGKDTAGRRQGSSLKEASGEEGRESVFPAYFNQCLLRGIYFGTTASVS